MIIDFSGGHGYNSPLCEVVHYYAGSDGTEVSVCDMDLYSGVSAVEEF